MAAVKPKNCIDCGKRFYPRSNRGKHSGRCPDCQATYNLLSMRQRNLRRHAAIKAGVWDVVQTTREGGNSIRHEDDPGAPYPVPVAARPRPDGFVRVEDCW